MSAFVQLHPHKSGDLWPGLSSVVIRVDGVPLNLTGAVLEMQFKRYATDALPALRLSSTGGAPGMTVVGDPAAGMLRVPGRVVTLRPGRYFWDIQVTVGGQPVTYATGTWQITPDFTN